MFEMISDEEIIDNNLVPKQSQLLDQLINKYSENNFDSNQKLLINELRNELIINENIGNDLMINNSMTKKLIEFVLENSFDLKINDLLVSKTIQSILLLLMNGFLVELKLDSIKYLLTKMEKLIEDLINENILSNNSLQERRKLIIISFTHCFEIPFNSFTQSVIKLLVKKLNEFTENLRLFPLTRFKAKELENFYYIFSAFEEIIENLLNNKNYLFGNGFDIRLRNNRFFNQTFILNEKEIKCCFHEFYYSFKFNRNYLSTNFPIYYFSIFHLQNLLKKLAQL
jgi:hypothetical protein